MYLETQVQRVFDQYCLCNSTSVNRTLRSRMEKCATLHIFPRLWHIRWNRIPSTSRTLELRRPVHRFRDNGTRKLIFSIQPWGRRWFWPKILRTVRIRSGLAWDRDFKTQRIYFTICCAEVIDSILWHTGPRQLRLLLLTCRPSASVCVAGPWYSVEWSIDTPVSDNPDYYSSLGPLGGRSPKWNIGLRDPFL